MRNIIFRKGKVIHRFGTAAGYGYGELNGRAAAGPVIGRTCNGDRARTQRHHAVGSPVTGTADVGIDRILDPNDTVLTVGPIKALFRGIARCGRNAQPTVFADRHCVRCIGGRVGQLILVLKIDRDIIVNRMVVGAVHSELGRTGLLRDDAVAEGHHICCNIGSQRFEFEIPVGSIARSNIHLEAAVRPKAAVVTAQGVPAFDIGRIGNNYFNALYGDVVADRFELRGYALA